MKKFALLFFAVLTPLISMGGGNSKDVVVDGIKYHVEFYYEMGVFQQTAYVISNDENEYKGDVVIPKEIHDVFTEDEYENYLMFGANESMFNTSYITGISVDAFRNCTGLRSITLPHNDLQIYGSGNPFSGCTNLTSIRYTDNPELDAYNALIIGKVLVTGRNTTIIPDFIKRIGDYAFEGCSGLTSVSLPQTIAYSIDSDEGFSIGDYAFKGCTSLKSVSFPENYTAISLEGLTIGKGAFQGCESLKSITFPDVNTNSGYRVGSYAFENCTNIETVTILSSNGVIGEKAFVGCNKISDVYCYTENPPNSNKQQVFDTSISNATLHTYDYAIETYKGNEVWNRFGNYEPFEKTTIFYLTYYVDGEKYQIVQYYYGDTITPLDYPIKEGYSFLGWEGLPTSMPGKDISVNGSFTINKYKLTYTVDGEKYKEYEIEYNSSITPESEPSKDGYTFSGWSDIPEVMPAHDVEVKGSFTVNKYKLRYEVDGAEYKTYDVEYGAKITPEPEPTKEGYSFSGWSTIPETMPANDVTITGTFSKGAYKLTYMVDGYMYKVVNYDFGDAITPEPAPTKEGYTFSGWSDIPATMPAEDITVSGAFTINQYKLTYMVDGQVYKEYTIDYGSTITPEAAPTKDGYTFSGWDSVPNKMPANDVVVNGTFTKNEEPDPEPEPEPDPEPEPTPEPTPTPDPEPDPTPDNPQPSETDVVMDNVKYEVEGNYAAVVNSGNASGELKIEATVSIGGKTYEVTMIAKGAFKGCVGLTSVEMPNSITSIGEKAFDGCSGLQTIKIGSGIKEIARKAFANIFSGARTRADNGLHIYCESDLVPTTSPEAFVGTDIANATLHVKDELVDAFKYVTPWNEFGTIMGLSGTGINQIVIDSHNAMIFDMHGNRIDKLQQGVNIIRMRDGKTKKVLVR